MNVESHHRFKHASSSSREQRKGCRLPEAKNLIDVFYQSYNHNLAKGHLQYTCIQT